MAEACRAFGRAGRGRQRQPLQRDARPRHRPDAGRRPARHGRRVDPPASRARVSGRGRRSSSSAERRRRAWPGRDGLGSGAPRAGTLPAPDLDAVGRVAGAGPRARRRRRAGRCPRRGRRRPGAGAGRDGRRRRGRAPGAQLDDHRLLFAESVGRVVVCCGGSPHRLDQVPGRRRRMSLVDVLGDGRRRPVRPRPPRRRGRERRRGRLAGPPPRRLRHRHHPLRLRPPPPLRLLSRSGRRRPGGGWVRSAGRAAGRLLRHAEASYPSGVRSSILVARPSSVRKSAASSGAVRADEPQRVGAVRRQVGQAVGDDDRAVELRRVDEPQLTRRRRRSATRSWRPAALSTGRSACWRSKARWERSPPDAQHEGDHRRRRRPERERRPAGARRTIAGGQLVGAGDGALVQAARPAGSPDTRSRMADRSPGGGFSAMRLLSRPAVARNSATSAGTRRSRPGAPRSRLPFVAVEGVDDVEADQGVQVLARLAHDPSPSASRRRMRPSRMRVFTVPSGTSSSAAISVWVSPPK